MKICSIKFQPGGIFRRRAAAWGCSKSELNDRIFRLERMLKSLNYEEEGAL